MNKTILPEDIVRMILSYDLTPSPTALLIKYRFGERYYGTRTIYEINVLKEEMEKAKKKYDEVCSESRKGRSECFKRISELDELCAAQCKEPNRGCCHSNEIECEEEYVDDYYRFDSKYKSMYDSAKHKYTKEIAKKEGWDDEYSEECDRDFQNWSESMY
jgi:hypothetical protein